MKMARTVAGVYIWTNLTNKLNRAVANKKVTFNKTYLSRKKSKAWKKKLCYANRIRDG